MAETWQETSCFFGGTSNRRFEWRWLPPLIIATTSPSPTHAVLVFHCLGEIDHFCFSSVAWNSAHVQNVSVGVQAILKSFYCFLSLGDSAKFASSTSSLQVRLDEIKLTAFVFQLFRHLLEDNLHVVEVESCDLDLEGLLINVSNSRNINPFPLIGL